MDKSELLATIGKSNRLFSSDDFKVPHLLYRYTSLNEFTLKHLKENSFIATSPTEFNDLYDSTMHFNTALEDQNRINELNNASQEIGFGEIVNDELRKDYLERADEKDQFMLTYLTKDFRIVCFSANCKDIKMWSHYGNNNKGICISYDLNKWDEFIYPVIYMDEPIDVTELCKSDNNIQLAVLISVISKFRDWEYEKEWRRIFYLEDSKEKRVPLIGIPKPECIFLGNRFVENYSNAKREKQEEFNIIKEFIEYVETSKIKLRLIEPQVRSFSLNDKEISIDEIKKQILNS